MMAPGEKREIVAEDVDCNGRHHEKQTNPDAPIVMRPFPIRVRFMMNTVASWSAVLVGTVFEFIHRCFLDSIFRGLSTPFRKYSLVACAGECRTLPHGVPSGPGSVCNLLSSRDSEGASSLARSFTRNHTRACRPDFDRKLCHSFGKLLDASRWRFHPGTVFAAARSPIASRSMIQSSLCR